MITKLTKWIKEGNYTLDSKFNHCSLTIWILLYGNLMTLSYF